MPLLSKLTAPKMKLTCHPLGGAFTMVVDVQYLFVAVQLQAVTTHPGVQLALKAVDTDGVMFW